jgi:NAD(P)-dependent dehydrogenase (short-subunit alcohol dehydrogenase family)
VTGPHRYAGRVALVTGAGTSGIGRAICARLAAEGAQVAVNDLRQEDAAEAVAALPGGSSVHLAVGADVSDSSAVDAMHDAVVRRFDRLDVLVNGAAVPEGAPGELSYMNETATRMMAEAAEHGRRASRWDMLTRITDDSWNRMLAIVLSGTFFNLRAAIPRMIAGGGGAIVNISSGAALTPTPSNLHYAAAKAGVLALTRAAAADYGDCGIRVNAVLPGLIDTPAQRAGLNESMRVVLAAQTPMGRIGLSEEIAATVAFLASDDASYTTGQSIEVNGGMHM